MKVIERFLFWVATTEGVGEGRLEKDADGVQFLPGSE